MTNGPEREDTAAINALQQITGRQWLIAAIVLIAVPVVAYAGTFYLYPIPPRPVRKRVAGRNDP